MNKILKITVFLLITFGCALAFWFLYLKDARENRLIEEGNKIVERVESFRFEHDRLPVSLEEIGLSAEEEEKKGADALFYNVRSDTSYTVSFGMSIDYNKFYYSDTKRWEDGYR